MVWGFCKLGGGELRGKMSDECRFRWAFIGDARRGRRELSRLGGLGGLESEETLR